MIFIYKIFDAHSDTMLRMYKNGWGLDNPELMINIKNFSGYKNAIQVFALFNDGTFNKEDMLRVFNFFKKDCENHKNALRVCKNIREIEKNSVSVSAILAIEAIGNLRDFKISDIKEFYDLGVRFISLVWNHDNKLCGGCGGKGVGLTKHGKQALKEIQKLNIILDVSHMSDESFWEAFKYYSLPILATHSNSRSIHNHPRNLTDEQFLAIKESGGVCGINFYPPFLGKGEADIATIIKHIEHFLALGGENSIGLGSDFDGIDKTPLDLENYLDVYKLSDALLRLNYSEELVEKILYKNFYKLFKKFNH